MKALKELIKESFEMRVRMSWLKTINKEVNKREKAMKQFNRHNFIVKKLQEEYKKLYQDLWKEQGNE